MRYLYKITGCLLLLSFLTIEARATHLRAGEIVAVRDRDNPLRYCFTLTTYTDSEGGKQANDTQVSVFFFFGDEPIGQNDGTEAPRANGLGTPIPGFASTVNYYNTCHVFPGPGTYQVRVGIDNRNANVLNLGGQSSNINFFISTTIFINPQLGFNATPILNNQPLDKACVGRRFVHNPDAFDSDGDSIAFRLTRPRNALNREKTGIGVEIAGYQDPATGPLFAGGTNQAGTAPASFSINARTGLLTWDAPARAGEYNIAFIVEEWRAGIKIGEIVRDMQIEVEDCPNFPPQLVLPNDTCVEAGYRFTNVRIQATDRDNDPITITVADTSSNGIFGRTYPLSDRASFTTPAQPQPNPASGLFNWQTSCLHIRQQPYYVLFKAEDAPSNAGEKIKLVDLKTWEITVVAPKPKNLKAVSNPATKAVSLTWDSYSCQLPGAQIVIWRKVGCGYTPGPCERGLPASSGYVAVKTLPASATSFVDNNNGLGLNRGVSYSYRISVQFAPPRGGASLASDEVCVDLPLQMPVITNVTVDKTNRISEVKDGEITVKWLRPLELDKIAYPGPYAYRLYRAEGLNGTNYTAVSPNIPTTLNEPETTVTFQDKSGLNTKDLVYRYRLEFYFTINNTLTLLDTTSAASSVRLESLPVVNAIDLSWRANVPWSNENQTHVVYRESRTQPGVFNIIAQVPVQGPATFTYRDDGTDRFATDGNQTLTLSADSLYCYKVETVGTYGNARIPSPLRNFSQEICASPRDTVRPCPPVLSIDTLVCSNYYNNDDEPETCGGLYTNNLAWTIPTENAQGIKCKDPVRYNLYYKRYEEDAFDSIPIATIPAPLLKYVHQNLTSYAGCYYVTAVDRSGNESNPSNVVCKDNCPYYELPNVFTPNSDGKNDIFEPFPCPQFVESVEFTIYNRWGRKVFETNKNILIQWDGRTAGEGETSGKELSSWVYYYLAKVKFQRLRRQDEVQTIKGWVQILK
jgi:gliding motility-associated-like protein